MIPGYIRVLISTSAPGLLQRPPDPASSTSRTPPFLGVLNWRPISRKSTKPLVQITDHV